MPGPAYTENRTAPPRCSARLPGASFRRGLAGSSREVAGRCISHSDASAYATGAGRDNLPIGSSKWELALLAKTFATNGFATPIVSCLLGAGAALSNASLQGCLLDVGQGGREEAPSREAKEHQAARSSQHEPVSKRPAPGGGRRSGVMRSASLCSGPQRKDAAHPGK